MFFASWFDPTPIVWEMEIGGPLPGWLEPDLRPRLLIVSAAFHHLLDATIGHLQQLKASGVRHIEVRADLMDGLVRPSATSPARPGPAPAIARPALGATRSAPALASPPATSAPAPAPAPVVAASAALAAPLPPPVAPTDRSAAMAAIRERAQVCQKCPHLVRSRTQVVFGVGSLEAELMFVGEAPGADEDRLGEPFVGRAGQLLTRIITAMNLSRETVYIANILKCRPDLPAGGFGNRPPRPEEMETCLPYLVSQVEIIQPKVIVALGSTAVLGLLGIKPTMGSIRGRWQQFRGIPVLPTFHPSYLLRAEDGPDRGHAEKRKTWEDMLVVLERLQMPVTERMRGYFLKPAA